VNNYALLIMPISFYIRNISYKCTFWRQLKTLQVITILASGRPFLWPNSASSNLRLMRPAMWRHQGTAWLAGRRFRPDFRSRRLAV